MADERDVDREQAEVVSDALQAALDLADAGTVTRWLVVYEVVPADGGERELRSMNAGADGGGLPAWEESGMLFEMLHRPQEWSDDDSDRNGG